MFNTSHLFPDLDQLKKELEKDIKDEAISGLIGARRESTEPSKADYSVGKNQELICFNSVLELIPVMKEYQEFAHKYKSAFFKKIWETKVEELKYMDLSVDNFKVLLWKPVITECSNLLEKIKSKQIKLKEVDLLLSSCNEDEENNLFQQLTKLNKALELSQNCAGAQTSLSNNPDYEISQEMQESMDCLQQFQDQRQLVKTATIVLKVKEKLGIKADFHSFRDIAESMNDDMLNNTLDYITRFSNEVTFLKGEGNRKVSLCTLLLKFHDCFKIVEWIKQTKGKVVINSI